MAISIRCACKGRFTANTHSWRKPSHTDMVWLCVWLFVFLFFVLFVVVGGGGGGVVCSPLILIMECFHILVVCASMQTSWQDLTIFIRSRLISGKSLQSHHILPSTIWTLRPSLQAT